MIPRDRLTVEPIATRYGSLSRRVEAAEDAEFLFALFASVKGPELAAIDEPMRHSLLEMQFRAMESGYRARFPEGNFTVITLDGAAIGRLITAREMGAFHIVYIALSPQWRRHGIATTLLRALLEAVRSEATPQWATVARDNEASLRLWSRLGFTPRQGTETDVTMAWDPD